LSRSFKRLIPGSDVQLDWFSDLVEVKNQAFQKRVRELETSYLMFSVSLNEAIGLHKDGFVKKSLEVVEVSAQLCQRLSRLLENLLRGVSAYSAEHGTDPSVAPLVLTNFLGDRSRLLALKSLVRHRTLLRRRAQFQNKTRALRQIVRYAVIDFCASSDSVAHEGVVADRLGVWEALDHAHFDMNTCLRESVIMLKCFLQVLPVAELRRFEDLLDNHRWQESTPKVRTRAAAAGRLAGPAPTPSLKWS
jgi:hypothetical protein